jgi:hypothetical protein
MLLLLSETWLLLLSETWLLLLLLSETQPRVGEHGVRQRAVGGGPLERV